MWVTDKSGKFKNKSYLFSRAKYRLRAKNREFKNVAYRYLRRCMVYFNAQQMRASVLSFMFISAVHNAAIAV